MVIADLLNRLNGVTRNENGWQAKCPVHDDKKASLSIHENSDGKILLHCHAGCETKAILSAIGMQPRDIMPENSNGRDSKNDNVGTGTGTGSQSSKKHIVAVYNYTDEQGNSLYQVCRTNPKGFAQRRPIQTKDGPSWVWNLKGVTRVLFHLPALLEAVKGGKTIYLVEGEKDVITLERLGLPATTNSGGAGKWLKSYTQLLTGADVVVFPDNDDPGRKHANNVAKQLSGVAARTRIVNIPGIPEKGDVSDYVESGGTREELLSFVSKADDWVDHSPSSMSVGPDGEAFNDIGNARRFLSKCRDEIRYCADSGKWYYWDGYRWASDELGEILQKAKATMANVLELAQKLKKDATSEDERDALKAFEKHAILSGNFRKMQAMLSIAATDPNIAVHARDFDKKPYIFNCANGTLDLETGAITDHMQADMLSRVSPIRYDPDARCPVFEKFLQDIFCGDIDLVHYVKTAIGYSMTASTREQVFFILHGIGSNGKSTFINVIRDIMGEYEKKTSTDTLLEKNTNGTNDIASLCGARFVTAIETSAGKRLAEALVKELTGQDSISARFLYKEFFEFTPVFKIWLACNHVPSISGQDNGIWRRIRLIPFNARFYEPYESDTGPYKDKELSEKLKMEYPGILNWMVEGAQEWIKNGLDTPSGVIGATNMLKQDMDILGGFLSECCFFDKNAEIRASDLYQNYCFWAEKNGEKPLSQRWFGLRLSERGTFKRSRDMYGWKWIGIGLVDSNADSVFEESKRAFENPSYIEKPFDLADLS